MAISSQNIAGVNTTIDSELDDFIMTGMTNGHIPGVAAGIVRQDRLIWSKGYGWANIKARVAMSPMETVLNIGSVSKTVTATAVMQLWERGLFQLDDSIDAYLPFEIRNPNHPREAITFRQLLSHRSSIKDGPAYQRSYACGDPSLSLQAWLREYFTPDGSAYHRRENFHQWKPGEQGLLPPHPRNYSNLGFGLLGYLVEILSAQPFSKYCRNHIFEPLGMTQTAWHLAELDSSKHAVPYQFQLEGKVSDELIRPNSDFEGGFRQGGYLPYCLYGFPNYPDGLLRTSINQLSRFLMVYLNHGVVGEHRILRQSSLREMLRSQLSSERDQGLCWKSMQLDNGDRVWGHYGNDPGIGAAMFFRPADQIGVIVSMNAPVSGLQQVVNRLFDAAGQN